MFTARRDSPRFWRLVLGAFACLALLGRVPNTIAQEIPVDAELVQQQKIVGRFLEVLEKNPRRGTALDRVYGFHVENGSLDQLVKQFQERTAKNSKDGAAWTILGLIESKRGQDAAAVEAFSNALAAGLDPLPAYYQGQSLVLIGRSDQAVQSFEQALSRKPAPADLLEIFQALGRVHQRAQHTREALEVWNRLEKLFPKDVRVQEQIAVTLAEEGQTALALPRYEKLIQLTKDDYRKSVFRMEAAELKVKLNRSAEAIADYDQLLATLNPTSWLYREVRRKVEAVFLRTDDYNGLAMYYQTSVTRNPEDVDAMARLARILAQQGRVPEAQVWLDKALKLAPTRRELRQTFIEQLVEDHRYSEAVAQYELLDKSEPNNPDLLREWGKLLLRDQKVPLSDRMQAAEKVWRRMLAARPQDPLIAIQVADLFRNSEMHEAALQLYQQAVKLAPEQTQYLEYLGEHYHQLKRVPEALATWRRMTEGKRRTAANLARLADVLASFDYLQEAIPEIQAACQLDPKDLALQVKAANLLTKAGKYPEAVAFLERAEQLAQNSEEAEVVLSTELKVFELEDSLGWRMAKLIKAYQQGQPTAKQWFRLARYHAALQQNNAATQAIDSALKLEPNSIPLLAAAARIYEEAGELQSAADLNRRLAVVDRRGRADYLKNVAQLEAQLGRSNEALLAGRELINVAPGNSDNYEFYANLCFRLGKTEEGLQTLRRAARVDPSDPRIALSLATALTNLRRLDEAIELYWLAFEKSPNLDDKLSQIQKLTELHLETNLLEKLLERLRRMRRDAEDKREATICLAQAYNAAGDLGLARQELESLVTDHSRDTQLLSQLSKLASTEGDLVSAVKYQQQLAKLAPGPETELPLATLLAEVGETQESTAITVRLAAREQDPEKFLSSLDSLISAGQDETVLALTAARLRERPHDWELLYREGVALAKKSSKAAAARFQTILDLPNADHEPGVALQNQIAKSAKFGPGSGPSAVSTAIQSIRPIAQDPQSVNILLSSTINEIRNAVGLSSRQLRARQTSGTWTPADFGQARIAALGWEYRFARDSKQSDEFVAKYHKSAQDPRATPRVLWDSICVTEFDNDDMTILSPLLETTDFIKRLAAAGDPNGEYLYLNKLSRRGMSATHQTDNDAVLTLTPLSKDEISVMLSAFHGLRKRAQSRGSAASGMQFTSVVMSELKRAGELDEEQKLYHSFVDGAQSSDELSQAILFLTQREDVPGTLKLFDKWSVAMRSGGSDSTAFKVARAIAQLMGINGEAKRHVDCLNLLDHFLDHHLAMRRLHRPQPAARQNRTPGMPGMLAGRLHYIWYGKQEINVRMTFPTSRTYYDDPALTVLRTAFEAFRRNEELPELQTHFVQRLEKAVGGDRLYEHLALGYLNWWNDEQDAAVQQLIAASQLAGQDWQLKLEVAQLQVELQQFNDALALVDTMPAIDQESLRERELLALNLATRLGDSDRARQAAERLFGLRLDGPTQLNLARQMQQLGMRDQAEAVLSRVQNQASGQLPSLVEIMQSHQASGREELAAQIALQIVRKSPASQTPPPRSPTRVGSVNGVAKSPRTLAFEVLKKSGKLKELISITEEQLQRSPKSGQLVALLSEYYTADGNPQQALKAELRLLESKPDDVSLRLRYTRKLISSGDLNEACEHYLLLIKAQPDLLRTEFVNISVAFASAKRVPEFVKVLEEIDIHQLPSRPETMRLVRLLFSAPGQHAAGIALLKRLSSAFPDSRNELFNDLTFDEHIWVVPEIYELGKKSLFPVAGRLQNDPWTGFSRVIIVQSANNTFGVTNMTRRILDAAAELNKLPELQSEIAEQVEAFPDWKLGPLLIALIDVRLGQIDAARPTLERLATLKNSADSPYGVRWNVGQELETNNELLPLSIRFYERALEIGPDRNIRSDFAYGPGSRLLKLYIKLGQREQALKLLGTMEKQSQAGSGDPRLAAAYAQQKTQTLFSIAAEYENLDSLLNAARLYRRILNEPVTNETTFASNVRSVESTVSQAKSHWNRLMAKLATSQDLDWTDALLTPNAPVDKPALDLMLELRSNPNGMPRIESQLNELLSRQKPTPQVLAAMRDRFRELERQRPQDLSVLIVDALSALAANDRPQSIAALANLEAFLDRTPLEPLMQGKLPNSRQRNTALHQVALWLVASKCLQRDEYLADGQLLAARALEASKRQSETSHAIAIHYELAQHALLSKDVTAAEQHLSELLTLVLPPFQVKKFGRSTLTESAQVPANSGQRATPTNPVDSGRLVQSTPNVAAGQSVYPVTYTQFRQSMVVADLALENQMLALAGRAMRESLAGGFLVADPVVNQNVSGSSGPVRSSPRVMTTLSVPTGPSTPTNVVPARVAKPVGKPVVIDESLFNNSVSTISSRLLAISNAWREKGHPPQEIYAAFKDIVLPKSRREEIVLYEQTLTKLQSPKSLGHELVLWSVAANEVDALRKEIAARNSNPSSLLKGNVLLVQLAIASNETAGAVQPLKLLAELVKADPQIRTVTTAAQAASVAMTRTELAMDAAPVLVAGLPILSKQNPNEADHVRSLLTRYYLAQHKTDELRTLIDEQLEAKRNQYGPNLDYVNYKQRIELTTLIDAIAPHTEFPLLLEYLGRLTDLPVSQNYGEPAARTAALSTPLWYFAWHLRALTPDTRYALLKDSTLPNENRKSLRYFSGFLRGRQAPVSFLTPREIALGPPPQIGLASNFSLLVEAAGKAGRLDELQVLADQAVTEKLPHAEGLSVLVAIARGDRDANLKLNLFLDASRKRVKTLVRNDMNVSTYAESRLLDLEIAAVAQTSDLTFNTGREFATAVLRENQAVEQQSRLPNARLPHAGWVVAQGAMHGLTPPDQERLRQPNLRLWRPGNPPLNTHNSRPPAWWVAEAGHVVCLGGFEAESLIFRYPLTGSFEFSAEVHSSNFSEGSLGYGGLVTEPQVRDKDVQIWPISRHEFVQRGAIPVAENHWNRYSVRVTPQAIRFYCNGHLAYEELAPSATSPWLSLQGLYYRRSVFRNLQLTGEPQIPRQVELILDDRREGWDEAEGEQTAPRLLNRELPENLFARRALQQNEGRPVDWHVESSILNGRYDAAAPEFTQGCFRYFRPLHNGEQLKYEFLYEPGKTHVHPAIGSLAMLLEPAGVRVHWLALDPVDTEGLEPGNVADEPQNRRGPANLPLKPGMWNQVEISTAGETMRLKLNGELVFERPVESVNSRQFALFHYRNLTAAKVRNVVLSGNWPAKMTPQELSNLLVPENPEESVSLRRARHLLIHEEKFVDSAYQVAIAARGMAPEQRYEMLREWVLPVPTHPTLRLQAGFTPVDPPLVTAAEAISKLKGTRQHLGGELVAPAMELVRTATELKRLKELEQAILAAQREVPEISRDHQALKIMLACAQGDESAASIGFKSLMESMKSRDPAMPQEIPFAELLALRAMLDRPSVRLEVAEQAKTHLDSNRQVGEWDSSWRAMLHAAVNNAQSQGQVPSRLSQWTTVSHLTAQSRAKGERPADWQGARGQARFLAGNGDTALYFQSPLAGNLELRMRKTTSSTGEIRPMYACIGIELKDDHEWFMRRMQGRARTREFPKKLEFKSATADYRLVVQDREYTVYVNETKVHTETLTADIDPWLSIQTTQARSDGTVEDIQILGTPTVPEVIKLSETTNLVAWRATFYDEAVEVPDARWKKNQEEIVGTLHENSPGSHRQSVLQYHRPMLEDGEIQYDFYHESGKTEAHPAMDRAAFILTATGIKLHYLTDGAFDRSGLSPDNSTPLPDSPKTLPLKDKDWNTLRLTLTGDLVVLTLNGEKVGSYTLEATNQRIFGLFRYSSETTARVKNATYRGNWPKSIPVLTEQELAVPTSP